MRKRMAISTDEGVYVYSDCELKKAYCKMAADLEREKEAKEWSEGLIQDLW